MLFVQKFVDWQVTVNFTDCIIFIPSFPQMVKQTEGYTFLQLRCAHIPKGTWGHPVQTNIALLYSTHQSYMTQDIANQNSYKKFIYFSLLTVQHYDCNWTPRFCLTPVYYPLLPFHILPLLQHNIVFQINFFKTLPFINREYLLYSWAQQEACIHQECRALWTLFYEIRRIAGWKKNSQFCQMWTSYAMKFLQQLWCRVRVNLIPCRQHYLPI